MVANFYVGAATYHQFRMDTRYVKASSKTRKQMNMVYDPMTPSPLAWSSVNGPFEGL